jgi:uncharacterized ferredoxin-like protein
MKYTAEELGKQAVLQVAALMAAAIRTAPKAFAIPLSVSKKSIYFDRGSVSTAQPIFPD